MNFKTFSAFIIILILAGIASAAYATYVHSAFKIGDGKDIDLNGRIIGNGTFSGSFISTVNISNSSQNNSFSYLIWTDGSTIFAKNGSTGLIDYSGTSASTVIQNTINLTPIGGLIIIKRGTYNLTTTLTIGNTLTFWGEGHPLYYNPMDNGTLFLGSADPMFNFVGGSLGEGSTIGNLGIYSSVLTNTIINLNQTASGKSALYMYNFRDLYLRGGNYGIFAEGIVINNVFDRITTILNNYGVYANGYIAGSSKNFGAASFINSNFRESYITAIYLRHAINVDIQNSIIESNYRNGTEILSSSMITIEGNHFENNGIQNKTTSYDILAKQDPNNWWGKGLFIEKNYFYGTVVISTFIDTRVSFWTYQNNLNSNTTGTQTTLYVSSASNYGEISGNSGGTYTIYAGISGEDFGAGTSTLYGIPPGGRVKGDKYFNVTTNTPCYYNGTTWNRYTNNTAGC